MKVVFLTFNYGLAGKYVNGPGMCLVNFVDILKRQKDINVVIFSQLQNALYPTEGLSDTKLIRKEIESADIVHHWSGLDAKFANLCTYAKNIGKRVIVGPNVIDCVKIDEEKAYLSLSGFDKLLTVNDRIILKTKSTHGLTSDKFLIGPDLNLWKPLKIKHRNNNILWKGNGRQPVKDVDFALKLSQKLREYSFTFIGHPKPYNYLNHIPQAKGQKLFIATSISETMGLAMLEQMAAGIPVVTHPKIYFPIENYKQGICTSKDLDSYASAIKEIMLDSKMYKYMSEEAASYVHEYFSDQNTIKRYYTFLEEQCREKIE
jgi:hypothetical protein